MDQVRLEMHETKPVSMDIDGTPRFAKSLLGDPAGFWKGSAEHRLRLQQAIYPNGLHYDGELVGTAKTFLASRYSNDVQSRKEGMASPTGLEPVLPP